MTPLHLACQIGWCEAAFALVHHGASLCAIDKLYDPSSSFSRLSRVHSRVHRGWTALHFAARYGNSDVLTDSICMLHKFLAEDDHLSWINAVDKMYAACALSFSRAVELSVL